MPSKTKNDTVKDSKFKSPKIAAAAATVTIAAGGLAATALAAGPSGGSGDVAPLTPAANKDRNHYQRVYDEAERYDVAPKRNLAEVAPASPELRERAAVLNIHVVGQRGKEKLKEAIKPEFPAPESLGVSQATLDTIASCESGGDPTVVDASGTYYGLYQFDMGTWASVGGSGSPADASAEEQSYRAALLYSKAGSSPWPVCGV